MGFGLRDTNGRPTYEAEQVFWSTCETINCIDGRPTYEAEQIYWSTCETINCIDVERLESL